MSFTSQSETGPEPLAKPASLLRVPVGMASPLWGLFAGAAMTGATWWWMTRWARPQNLEAMFATVAETQAAIEPELAALAVPVIGAAEAVEAVAEPVVEVTAEAMVEPTPEPVLEALVEMTFEPAMEALAEVTPEPVLEALTPEIAAEPALAAKPKKKAAIAPPAAD